MNNETPDSVLDDIERALTAIMLARLGLESNGFQYGVLMSKNLKTGDVVPLLGIYKREPQPDGKVEVAWIPFFAFLGIADAKNWAIQDDDGEWNANGRIVTGAEYKMMKTEIKAEPS